MEVIRFGQEVSVCGAMPYGPPYGPRRRFHGCYAPGMDSFCTTTHFRLWANAAIGVPPAGSPTWDGYGDYRPQNDGKKVVIIPGVALAASGGLGKTGLASYLAVVDDASGNVVLWLTVNDWTWITNEVVNNEQVNWVALAVIPSNVPNYPGATGSTGATGAAGNAATITIGTVSSVAYPGPPTVTNVGTSTAAVLNFALETGPAGASAAAPTVSSVTPNFGSTLGGTDVTIAGTNFYPLVAVTFNGVPAESQVWVSSTEVMATAPAGSAGTIDVQVTSLGGTSATSASDQFTYDATGTYWITFDGVNQAVNFGVGTVWEITSSFTLSFFMIAGRVNTGTPQVLVGRVNTSSAYYYYFQENGGEIQFVVSPVANGTGIAAASWPISANVLYHIAGVYNGTDLLLYVNAVLVATTAYSSGVFSNTSGSSEFEAGWTANGVYPFQGQVTALRLYNAAISGTDITQIYGGGQGLSTAGLASANLTAWYQFTEGSGTSTSPTSGGNGSASLVNGAGWTPAPIFG